MMCDWLIMIIINNKNLRLNFYNTFTTIKVIIVIILIIY